MIHYPNKTLRNTLVVFLALITLGLTVSAQSRPYRYPSGSGYANNRLSGTWRLNASRSDNPRAVAERATRNFNLNERQRVQENLIRRLESPNTLAIDRRGQTVTLASSRGSQVTFEANGIETSETLRNGRERRTRSTFYGDRLLVRTQGDRGSDYEVIFEPLNDGRSLRVTRSLYTERLNQAVVSRSVYDRVSDVAQLDIDRERIEPAPASGSLIVPDGTQLTARLNQPLSTKQTREGDRFTLSVINSGQYNGAVIEGVVASKDRPGRLTGRADMTLDFERIRLRDGRTYDFAGTIDRVQLPNGETLRVDQEGNVEEDDSQTSRTVERTAIGGAIGAVIGAITGGGKGAAIGAAIGAGAGAGSIFIEGRDDLELPVGTEIYIRASAPRWAAR
jgi:hypothetical protein